MIKIGVIGVGYLGKLHARVLSNIKGVKLIGVVDIIKERAEKIATTYYCKSFTDYKKLLPLVDAVVIATPTVTHYEIAIECIEKDKDILLEKPITATLKEADILIEKAIKKNKLIQVGHIERFNPVVKMVKNMVNGVRFFESERLSPPVQRSTDIDVTLDLMIHDIDIILSLNCKKIINFDAIGTKILTEKIDIAKAWIEMENGTSALFTASRVSEEKKRVMRIFKETSIIEIDYQNLKILFFYKNKEGGIQKNIVTLEYKEPLKEEIKEFIYCIKERKKPKVDATDAREALKVALEITERIQQQWT